MKVCESCAMAKAKQKKVHSKKEPNEKHNNVNGQVYIDQTRINNPNAEEQPLRPYWTIVVDKKTGFKTTIFTSTKGGMNEILCQLMQKWTTEGRAVQTI